MRFLIPFKKYTLDDLPTHPVNVSQLRHTTRILIVDDEPFYNEAPLRAIGFNLTVKNKWDNITDAEPFHIIVSDNRGVASSFSSAAEGAFVLNQIHKNYPQKGCIIYSRSAIDFSHTPLLRGIKQMKKNDDSSEWEEVLSETINEIYDPKSIWLKIESYLEDQNISRKILRNIENTYVRALLKGNGANIEWSRQDWNLSSEAISLVTEFFKLATTALGVLGA